MEQGLVGFLERAREYPVIKTFGSASGILVAPFSIGGSLEANSPSAIG